MNVANQIALNNSTQNSARISKQKKQECIEYTIPNFENTTATIQQKQQHADCIDRFHPSTLSGGEVLFFKILIVTMLIGIFTGFYQAYRENKNYFPRHWKDADWSYFAILPLSFGFFTPAVVAILFGVVYAVIWLFTV